LAYKVIWHTDAIKDLLDLDKNMQKKLAVKIKDYLAKETLTLGEPLHGIFKGLYRYRYGNYLIVYSIDRSNENVIILRIGHRKDIYK
jgi:mRNA interferase RelE/StbE